MKTRVVCVGNELVCDDGVGIRVGRVLKEIELPVGAEVSFAADVGLDLIDTVMGAEQLILVDATCTSRPTGTVQVMSHTDVSELAQTSCCCHAVGLPELLKLAGRLDPAGVPPRVVLVGIEAEVLDQFGTGLSPAVRAALPEAVAVVLEQLGADSALIESGRQRAAELADFSPSPLEAHGG